MVNFLSKTSMFLRHRSQAANHAGKMYTSIFERHRRRRRSLSSIFNTQITANKSKNARKSFSAAGIRNSLIAARSAAVVKWFGGRARLARAPFRAMRCARWKKDNRCRPPIKRQGDQRQWRNYEWHAPRTLSAAYIFVDINNCLCSARNQQNTLARAPPATATLPIKRASD